MVSDLELAALRLLHILNIKEESDSGVEFNPVTIGYCRTMLGDPLHEVLADLDAAGKEVRAENPEIESALYLILKDKRKTFSDRAGPPYGSV